MCRSNKTTDRPLSSLTTLFLNSVPANSSSTTIYMAMQNESEANCQVCFYRGKEDNEKEKKTTGKSMHEKKHLQSYKKNSLVIYGNTLSWHLTSVIVMKITSESKDKPKGHAQREKNVLFGCFCLCFKKRNEMYATATSLLPAWELQVLENAFSLSHMLRKVNFIE